LASGIRSTSQNTGTALSIGVFFSLMIVGLSGTLQKQMTAGLVRHGVSSQVAHHIGTLSPVSSLFASVLGVNPIRHLLAENRALASLSSTTRRTLTSRQFFPQLISGSFHNGLVVVFVFAAALSAIAAVTSLLRGDRELPAANVDSLFP
jgi:hypothetical protein